MIKIKNKKGFEIFQVDILEALDLGWGCICCECNGLLTGLNNFFYVAALNDAMHKKCLEKWYSNATYYAEDAEFERNMIKGVMKRLELEPTDISIMDIGLDK